MNPRLQLLTHDVSRMTPVLATVFWPDGTLLLSLTADGAEFPRLVVLDVEPRVLDDLREGNLAGAVALVRSGRGARQGTPLQTQH